MDNSKRLKKYEILRENLISYISENKLKPNDKLPTINEIIDKFRYSYATVNRTLIEMENEGIIKKHQGKGLYVNNVKKPNINKQIALIIPSHFSNHKIFMDILAGVRSASEKTNIGVLVSISNMSHQKEKETIEMLLSKNIDGMLIFMEDSYRKDYSHIVELKERGFPFVLIDRYIPELETDYVVVNNKNAMLKIASYLKYKVNCEDLFYVPDHDSYDNISSAEEKVDGLNDAYKLLYGKGRDCVISFKELVKKTDKLRKENHNIGIIFNHDEMVSNFVFELENNNHSMPDNFYLFGYNNSKTLNYPTVEQFNLEVGKKATEILIEKLNKPNTNDTKKVMIEPKLILPNRNGTFVMEK